ncbi:MAG: AAA family ATPase [Clostridiales bacterium]|jgi:ATP-dependent Clp protease ATP-binding subunit ClpA|nr:AAA family ATPase [Clostridiales bacterium]
MKLDDISSQVYVVALNEARLQHHEYITPEHFLYAALMFDAGRQMVSGGGGNLDAINRDLRLFFEKHITWKAKDDPLESFEYIRMFELATAQAHSSGRKVLLLGNILAAIFNLQESFACYILLKNGVDKLKFLKFISHAASAPNGVNAPKPRHGTQEEFTDGVWAAAEKKLSDEDFLRAYAVDLSDKAKRGMFDPLVGREDIFERTIQVLSRRLKNNPLHVGDPGVGKTALVEGLAQRICDGNVPPVLIGARIFHIDVGAVVAGTRYRGDFEERMLRVLDIISRHKKPIVYLDEIHSAIGAGAASGSGMDATSIIKPYLASGQIRFIGSTTHEEYKKYIEKDRAFSRRFEKIEVTEPTAAECVDILKGLRVKYEEHHDVLYSDEVITLICELSARHLRERFLPDKAIDVMDETGAYIRTQDVSGRRRAVSVKDVERTVALMAKIPENTVSAGEADKLRHLGGGMKALIFGQDEAVDAVADAIKAARSGLNDMDRPVASFLFVGPTGVGKTEVAKQLARLLGIGFSRFDMSEYQEKHSVARLIGAPPGYVGYEEGGLLTDAVRRTPHCVLLLDEIEKAHADVYNVLLQIMDYGSLTDSSGKKADFRNVIIVMTSNAGAQEMRKRIIGYEQRTHSADAVYKAVEKIFNPEFRNRLDKVVLFNPVDMGMALKVAKKAVDALAERLAAKGVGIEVAAEAYEYIASKGFSEVYGAREIIRVVENEIKRKLVDEVLFGGLKGGGSVEVGLDGGKLAIHYVCLVQSTSG